MASAKKILEKKIGPLTVGRLIRAYRTMHDMTAEELALKLSVTRSFISNIESGRKHLSLEKTLQIAQHLKEHKEFYALIWFEEEARKSGINFDKIIKLKAA